MSAQTTPDAIHVQQGLPPSAHDADRDWLAIINPSSGRPRSGRSIRRLAGLLRHELGAEVVVTRSLAQIAELLRSADRACRVAVFGGDGTIAEVVNHMQLAAQSLLPLPGGTGNGLARDLGIRSIGQAVHAQRSGSPGAIDVLEATLHTAAGRFRRLVISTAAIGYVSDTVAWSRRLPRTLGSLRYLVASAVQTRHMPSLRLAVALDEDVEVEVPLTNLMVNNTGHAGGFCMFPRARLDDGRCDLLLADATPWQQVLYNITVPMRTLHYRCGCELRAQAVHVRSAEPVRIMLDGEIWEDVIEVGFQVLPRRLRCYCGSRGGWHG
jgi:diacylglycerol kinase (ATP)